MKKASLQEAVVTNEWLAKLDVIAKLHSMPPTTLLPTDLAADFLFSSVSSMERMRVNGSGPSYSQGGGRRARGTNQKCLYMVSDLLAWHEDNKVRSSMEAAVRKGQV